MTLFLRPPKPWGPRQAAYVFRLRLRPVLYKGTDVILYMHGFCNSEDPYSTDWSSGLVSSCLLWDTLAENSVLAYIIYCALYLHFSSYLHACISMYSTSRWHILLIQMWCNVLMLRTSGLHVGQVRMLVYIYKAEILSVCLSVMPITCLGLLTSTYFINLWTPQTHHPPTSSLSQQVNAVISLRSAATWRKLKQLFFENHSTDSQMGSAIDLHSEVVGSNPAGKWFFLKIILFECTFFLKFSFDGTVSWHSKYASKWNLSEIKCTSSVN